tara:strand:- start:1275 stop:1649 length:375 start_codon:yes stop_codon:yes gene_type:complete
MGGLTGFSTAADLSEDSTKTITVVQDVESFVAIDLDLKANVYLEYFEPAKGFNVYNKNFIQDSYNVSDGLVQLHLKPPLQLNIKGKNVAKVNLTKEYQNLKYIDPRRIPLDKIISCPRDSLRTI